MDDRTIDYEFQKRLQSLLSGDLSPEDRGAFLKEIKTSEGDQAELTFSRSLLLANRHRETVAASLVIAQAIQAERGQQLPAKKPFWKGWYLMLGFAVLAGVWTLSPYTPWAAADRQDAALAASYLKPLENVLAADPGSLLEQGLDAYDSADFTGALGFLSQHYRQTRDANTALYIGVCNLMTGNRQEAIDFLEPLAASSSQPLRESACFYLALANLQAGKREAAREWLQQIALPSPFVPDAQSLFDDLNTER